MSIPHKRVTDEEAGHTSTTMMARPCNLMENLLYIVPGILFFALMHCTDKYNDCVTNQASFIVNAVVCGLIPVVGLAALWVVRVR
jgi:hypothetical protein